VVCRFRITQYWNSAFNLPAHAPANCTNCGAHVSTPCHSSQGEANFNEAQISRLEAAVVEVKTTLAAKEAELEELEAQRAKQSKEMKTVQEELDDAMVAKAKAEKARRKLQQELEDANVEVGGRGCVAAVVCW